MPRARIELATLCCSAGQIKAIIRPGAVVRTSDLYSIWRDASSILAQGRKIFVVPGEHGFSSFQVENVHWKCMCAAH